MLIWIVKIGIVDIIIRVSMMASQMAMSREGHLEAVLHVFGFLYKEYNSRMVFNPNYPTITMSDFKECKRKDFYCKLK